MQAANSTSEVSKSSSSAPTIHELRSTFARLGRLEWLGIRPSRRAEVQRLAAVEVAPGVGLIGDHAKKAMPRLKALMGQPGEVVAPSHHSEPVPSGAGGPGKRQVTLIQAEHLPVIAALAGLETVMPAQLRRNLVVSGISLLALKDKRFYVGEVLLEGTGECHPCSRMQENLGPGGYNAVRGHGGITARVLGGGCICEGDAVRAAP